MGLSAALAGGALGEKTRERLALAIAESNLCPYWLSAHTAVAARIGLTKVEIDQAIQTKRSGYQNRCHPQTCARLCLQRGELTDVDLVLARAAGLSDGEIDETVANIALNIFENYMSHVARASQSTFPKANLARHPIRRVDGNGQR